MSELANIVRQRLASNAAATLHPDADTLTAYMERLLKAAEREQVQNHLAACSQCREVVLAGLPELISSKESAVPIPLPSLRRGWRFWTPAFGAAASAVALAILATMLIKMPKKPMQEAHYNPASPAASVSPSISSPAARPEQPLAPLESRRSTPPSTREEPGAGRVAGRSSASNASPPNAIPAAVVQSRRVETARNIPSSTSDSVWLAGGARQGYLNLQMFASSYEGLAPSPTGISELPVAPSPRSSSDRTQNVIVFSSSITLPALTDLPTTVQGNGIPRGFVVLPPSASRFGVPFLTAVGRDTKQLLQRRTTASITANSFVGHTMSGRQFNPARDTRSVEIMAAPLLEKGSSELGQSRAFSTRALANPATGYRITKATGSQPGWKVADGKLLKLRDAGEWVEGFPTDEVLDFTSVSSHGPEVWAGGNNAMLVHSSDGGVTWERITLGASARGSISDIELDGLRVDVRSTSGQSWSSSDGGKTWKLKD